jgi:beta-fructofuranosidase
MKKLLTLLLTAVFAQASYAQFNTNYNPANQPTNSMQYFTPVEGNLFAGDCIPFSHNGTYYLYWLLDKDHHRTWNWLGAHQWVLSTSTDLKNWKHYPIVLGLDEPWEKSICTGSLIYKDKTFYLFYATRLVENGSTKEQMSYATSKDGIHFEKQKPNPFYTYAPGYSGTHFRDPKVILDSNGVFNLLISTKEENAAIPNEAGCLVSLTSKDLKKWEIHEPILAGQNDVPECPDYFLLNGWYYMIYSTHGDTYYVKSKNKFGPWEYPKNQALKEQFSNVAKTAEFGNGRRIAASWVPSRQEGKDYGVEEFGGSILFREVIQLEDGTLGTKFPVEVIPETNEVLKLPIVLDTKNAKGNETKLELNATNGIGVAHFVNVPLNSRITMEIEPAGTNEEYGLYLHTNEKADGGYKLSFSEGLKKVVLGNTQIDGVEGLNKIITVDIIMKKDIIDVCIGQKRCIVNRLPEQKGKFLYLYAKQGNVTFKSIKIAALK